MIAIKTGSAWPEQDLLEAQLAASVWLFANDGTNSAGERLPSGEKLERTHAWIELMFLEQGESRCRTGKV